MNYKKLLRKIRPGKRVFFCLFALAFTAFLAFSFIFLRHRQLCSYQTYIAAENLTNNIPEGNLCPNLTNTLDWPIIAGNAFNLNLPSVSIHEQTGGFSLINKEKCTDQLNPLCWVGDAKPSLQKSDGYTNVLLVGTDNRGGKSKLLNTDSIMVASLHHASGKVMLVSFPRDLYVYYTNPSNRRVSYKINGIYALNGLNGLNGAISQIIGKPIHYYAYINIDIFSRVIDQLGGIDITLDKPFKDWYPCTEAPVSRQCPKGYKGFGTFTFPAGPNKFSSFDALVYGRARYLSSDFERARRQQHLLSSLMKQALNPDKPLTEKVSYYVNLYNIFRQEVTTNIELKDLAGIFAIAEQINANPLTLVADPNLAGPGRLITNLGNLPGVGYSIGFKDKSHRQFQNYVNEIWNNVAFYSERPRVLIVNASGAALDPKTSVGKLWQNKLPYAEWNYVESKSDLVGTRVYDLTDSKPASLQYLQSLVPGSLVYNAELDGLKRSSWNEDIVILYGQQEATAE